MIPTDGIVFTLLGLNVVALWLRPTWLWMAMLGSVCFVGLAFDTGTATIAPMALLAILAGAAMLYGYRLTGNQTWQRWCLLILISLFFVTFGMHALPGFGTWQVSPATALSDQSAEFAIIYHLDKPVIGILILGIAYSSLVRDRSQWQRLLRVSVAPILGGSCLIYLAGVLLGYVSFDPTFSSLYWPWAIKNLLFVCVAEEAFFRGFLQKEIGALLKHRQADTIALATVAILFGIAHFAGGATYVLLATAAGLVYGLVFYLSKRIEAAIAAHFLLNSGHFLFFTYPYRCFKPSPSAYWRGHTEFHRWPGANCDVLL